MKDLIKKIVKKAGVIKQLELSREIEWAHIYHDSIRGKEWLMNLPLNIGRWAGNYSFFYVLNRILNDYKPKEILELGLGESSKFVSVYIDNYLTDSNHTIIEQDSHWADSFKDRFLLSGRSSINVIPLVKKNVKDFEVNSYENIENFITKKYDLYIVDGPLGSPQYSRYDIVNIAEMLNKDDEFIIIFDDHNRKGEKQTFKELKNVFKKKDINIHIGFYSGVKEVAIIGTDKYRFVNTL